MAKFIPPAEALRNIVERTRGGSIEKRFVSYVPKLKATRNANGAVFVWSPHRSEIGRPA